jgi:hypothetical protein
VGGRSVLHAYAVFLQENLVSSKADIYLLIQGSLMTVA